MFVTPGLVFEEVVFAAPNARNWLVPLILVCLSNVLALKAATDPQRIAVSIASLVQANGLTTQQATLLSERWQSFSTITICVGAFVGTFWSAFVLWLMGKVVLKSQFSFHKALEVAGLTGTILMLGAVVTSLLIDATGDPSARPALSLLCRDLSTGNLFRNASALLDCFHLWATAVLAIGLSKLATVTLKESAFWVFGYWFVVRIALAVLA